MKETYTKTINFTMDERKSGILDVLDLDPERVSEVMSDLIPKHDTTTGVVRALVDQPFNGILIYFASMGVKNLIDDANQRAEVLFEKMKGAMGEPEKESE